MLFGVTCTVKRRKKGPWRMEDGKVNEEAAGPSVTMGIQPPESFDFSKVHKSGLSRYRGLKEFIWKAIYMLALRTIQLTH